MQQQTSDKLEVVYYTTVTVAISEAVDTSVQYQCGNHGILVVALEVLSVSPEPARDGVVETSFRSRDCTVTFVASSLPIQR